MMDLSFLSDIVPTRSFSYLYILLDSFFIFFFIAVLFLKKRYMTMSFALFGGVLYFIVDFFGFYLLAGSREVVIDQVLQGPGMTALVLLWMSLSYGITNFAYIWILLRKDKEMYPLVFLLLVWWFMAPILLASSPAAITTRRTTGEYHWIMAALLLVGYIGLVIHALFSKQKSYSILRLFLIGVSVQFFWEAALLVGGIRPFTETALLTLVVDSLLETNLGMPYIWLISFYLYQWRNEDLSKYQGERVPLWQRKA